MTKSFEAVRQAVLSALEAGDAHAAFRTLRVVLDYPGQMADPACWRDALSLFARIGEVVADEDLVVLVQHVADNPNDGDGLYDLGYQLVEQGLPAFAATVLARANELTPGKESLLAELISALERSMRY